MSKYADRIQWMFCLSLAAGLAAPVLTHAGQPKPKLDLEAEAKQIAEEEKKEEEARRAGPVGRQWQFVGTFHKHSDASPDLSPDVVGAFVTDTSDLKPGRTYLVKVENKNKDVLQALARSDRKKVRITGKLRMFGPDGEAKYLIVSAVTERAPTPPVVERRKFGGL
jgi:hypothetical protein